LASWAEILSLAPCQSLCLGLGETVVLGRHRTAAIYKFPDAFYVPLYVSV